MADLLFYDVGDYVTVENQNSLRLEVAHIEDFNKQQNVFTYTVYYTPEETHSGRQYFHGKKEIMRTTVKKEESIIYIESKIEVLKLLDYVRLNQEEKSSRRRFVCRQTYDPTEKKFTPEIEPECVCQQKINPDDALFVCDCEKIYHYDCVSDEDLTCSCGSSITEGLETLNKKRKLDEDKSVLLKSTKREEFYDLFASALDEAVTDKSKEKITPNKNSLNEKRPYPGSSNKKTSSNNSSSKKSNRKELLNIDDEAYQRVKNAVENFSQAHQNKTMSSTEKNRYFIKEKYYKVLLYGVEEVKEKHKSQGTYITEGEKRIELRGQKDNYQKAQDLALTIEATIWHAANNKTGVDCNYNMKNRELLNYLMDDNNYELRLSLLDGERKPESLCKATEKDLVPKKKIENIEKKQMQTLKYSLLPNEIKIIAKSHKGETVIECEEISEPINLHPSMEAEPILEDDFDALAEIVKRIDRDSQIVKVKREECNPQILNENEEFGGFKLHKKQTPVPKLYEMEDIEDPDEYNPFGYDSDKNKLPNKYEDLLQITDINGNKLIDQEVLKSAANVFFEKTYNNVYERLSHHLRPDLANSILDEINKRHKTSSD